MNNTITQEELLLFIYSEADPQKQRDIESALRSDNTLREIYAEMAETVESLDHILYEPQASNIEIILEEAAWSPKEHLC